MPNEIIPIIQDGESRAVSARELYTFLEVKERFSRWAERMFEYGFLEGQDYTPYILVHPQNQQQIDDYALTLDTAKEISMIQRSEKGKQAREYFIGCEKALRSAVHSGAAGPELSPNFDPKAVAFFRRRAEQRRVLVGGFMRQHFDGTNLYVYGCDLYRALGAGRSMQQWFGEIAFHLREDLDFYYYRDEHDVRQMMLALRAARDVCGWQPAARIDLYYMLDFCIKTMAEGRGDLEEEEERMVSALERSLAAAEKRRERERLARGSASAPALPVSVAPPVPLAAPAPVSPPDLPVGYMSVTAWAMREGVELGARSSRALGRRALRVCGEAGYQVGALPNGAALYPVSALERAFCAARPIREKTGV